jgi:D-alanyl-D-alanine endopeptidase (penicillin-binding protein 7)
MLQPPPSVPGPRAARPRSGLKLALRLVLGLAASAALFGLTSEAQASGGVRRPAPAAKSKLKLRKSKPAKVAKRRPVRTRAVPVYTKGGLPNIQAAASVVVDLERGTTLYEKNPDAVRPIASISKLMAMMVVLDRRLGTSGERALDLDSKTVITETDARLTTRGAKSRLLVGMALTNRDLLHAALMASDNRAVLALGRAVGLSPPALAAEMTAKARSLGLSKTEFHDPTGLDYRNVSTPREVVKMLAAALKEPLISQIARTAHFVAHSLPPRRDTIEYTNTDQLLRTSRHRVLGGKTGYNDRAGYCLVVAARVPAGTGPNGERREREVAMAFLGEEGELTRFADFGRAAQWLEERKPLLTSANETPRPAAPAPRLHARIETRTRPM